MPPNAPELSVTDGLPPPSDLPRGEFVTTRLADGSVRIDRADPRILISGQLLDMIADGDMSHMSLDVPCPWLTYVGSVLKIHGVNRQVVYRITEFVPRIYGYIGEWPD